MAIAKIFQFLITLNPFFFRKPQANISFRTNYSSSSDFSCKIRMYNNQKDVSPFTQVDDVGYNQFSLKSQNERMCRILRY